MVRKIGMAALLSLVLINTEAMASNEHTFSLSNAYEFTLPSKVPQIFSNIFFWTIEASCTIETKDASDFLSLTVLRKAGSLNGVRLTQGDSMSVTVHPGDVMHLTAESGGRIEMTNQGKSTVTALCSSGK